MINDKNTKLAHTIKDKQKQLKWTGIALIILGIFAIVFAGISTLFSMFYLGGLCIVGGVLKSIKAMQVRNWGRYFWFNAFLGFFMILAGILIVMNPLLNAMTLTLLLAIYFVFSGILRIILSFTELIPHQFLTIVNGLVSVALGLLIWSQWPISGLWVIGMFVGIDMCIAGWVSLSLSRIGID